MWHSCHFQLTCSSPHHKLLPSPHRCQQHSQRNFRQHIPTLLPKTRPSLLLSPRHCQPYFHFTTQPPLLPMLKLPLQRACFLHCQRKCRLRRHHFKQGNITLVTLMISLLLQSPHLITQPFYDVIPNATHDSSASPPTNPCLLKLQSDRLRTYLRWAQASNVQPKNPPAHPPPSVPWQRVDEGGGCNNSGGCGGWPSDAALVLFICSHGKTQKGATNAADVFYWCCCFAPSPPSRLHCRHICRRRYHICNRGRHLCR